MRALVLLVALLALTACAAPPMDPERAAQYCEERARAAQGPTGSVTLGVNSNSGSSVGAAIGVSGDFLAGRDPLAVYEDCVRSRTGQGPIRPPRLR
ncbi:MAG: hypothetical protein H3C51_04410 [Rubellimicrobium sp.]|nr:hypothetical protein [Rubellimicrobium sp.]